MFLIDCGKATRVTRGQIMQLYTEVGSPPFNKVSFFVCVPWIPGCPFP